MIFIYNSYTPRGTYVRTSENAAVSKTAAPRSPQRGKKKEAAGKRPQPIEIDRHQKAESRKPVKREGSILPLGLDVSDLMLAGVLLLLFMDSHDEDFLVILLVMMSSILMPDKK